MGAVVRTMMRRSMVRAMLRAPMLLVFLVLLLFPRDVSGHVRCSECIA
jgi:hypothetical protein